MLRIALPVLIVGLTVALSAAAIEWLPQTLYFPTVTYSTPDDLRVTLLQTGRRDGESCRTATAPLARAIRASYSGALVTEECSRGLTDEKRTALSRSPLTVPSARTADGAITTTFASADSMLSLEACRQTERLSAVNPAPRRVRCYPAGMNR